MILLFLLFSFGLAMYGETNNDHGYPQIGNHLQGWDAREQTKDYWTKVGNDELKKGKFRVMAVYRNVKRVASNDFNNSNNFKLWS